MSERWAAVVINYLGGPLLVDCVRSVLADTSAGPVELVVVDNGSADGSVGALLEQFPDVQVVRAPGNVGYARAANLGIAATHAPVIAVLNVDLTLAPGTARALVGRMEREPELGALGPRVQNLDGSDYPSARRAPSIRVAIGHGLLGMWRPQNRFTRDYRELGADPARPRSVDWVSGTAMWLRRRALDAVGGWDERYFMYVEDLDLCWRLRKDGWNVAYDPAGLVVHVQGASTRRVPYRMILEHHRSAWRFARRRFTGVRVLVLPFVAVFLGLRAALAMFEHAYRASGKAPSGG